MKRNLATKFLGGYYDGLFYLPSIVAKPNYYTCLRKLWDRQKEVYDFLLNKGFFWYVFFLYKVYRNKNLFKSGEVYKVSSLGATHSYELKPRVNNEEEKRDYKRFDLEEMYAIPHTLEPDSVFLVTKIEKNPRLKLNYLNLENHVLVEILLDGNKRYLVFMNDAYEKQALVLGYETLT